MGGVRFLKKWQPPLFPCPERGRGPCDPAQSLFTDSVPGAAIPPAAGGFFCPGPAAVAAPSGYPPIRPITSAEAPAPGAPKSFDMAGERRRDRR